MRLPINIEELLSGRAVEGDRIEYKTGWNPDAISLQLSTSGELCQHNKNKYGWLK